MINHQIARNERVDLLRIAPHADHSAAERGEIDDGGNSGEVLQYDASRHEGDFDLLGGLRIPVGQFDHVIVANNEVIDLAEARFQQHADRIRQPVHRPHLVVQQLLQPEDRVFATLGLEFCLCAE